MEVSLPEEILITIFLSLPEDLLPKCKAVCKTWERVADDPRLLYYFRRRASPISDIIVDSCESGNLLSFQLAVSIYCSFELGLIIYGSGAGTHDLWARSMISAAKGGHPMILRKVLSYGPTYGFKEAIREAESRKHLMCVEILKREIKAS